MKRTFKQLSLLLAFVGLANVSIAQGLVKGFVVDATTNEALIGATIRIDGTTQGAATSLDGSFSLKVGTRAVKLIFSYVGYTELSKEVTVSGDMSLGNVGLNSSSIGMQEIVISASIAKDRQTPVAVANIKAEIIQDKLGTQEFPEILKSTPSVYATKSGGGYGDGRINLRGFDSNNIGVLINGVPVNDMESGKVYWSNWAGLSDVTRTMQVQRGLGASKLALSSVGGTINIVTNSTEAKEGGVISYATGDDGYTKKSFTVSTGMLKNGWAVTISGAKTNGDGYVKGTDFDGYSYFLNVSKRINDNHQISYTIFGAPQWHNQRYTRSLIQAYRDSPDGIKMNLDYGYKNGKIFSSSYNYYHKPQMSINHFWKINDNTNLSTAVYASIATGGGRRLYGPTAISRTPEGYQDWDSAVQNNAASLNGSQTITANAINAHNWYGILSSLNTKVNNINITGGVDARYYKGFHAYKIDDLLGGKYYLDSYDINKNPGTTLKKGDYVSYHYLGEVLWEGLFLQGEYVKDKFSAFISGAASNTSYRRTDYFNYLNSDPNQVSPWQNFIGWSVKGGANYNINEYHNVFFNAGYFTRAPYFNSVFASKNNVVNTGSKNERILSTEVGYGFRSHILTFNLSLYRTAWLDKAFVRSTKLQGNDYQITNILGIDALHQGVEIECSIKPIEKLVINAMVSIGDWKWTSNANAAVSNESAGTTSYQYVYAKDIHVGDAAQTTAAINFDYEILPKFKIGFDYNYYDNLYAYFDVTNRSKENDPDAWKMPSYQLVDFNLKYDFKLGGLNATLLSNVDNIFNVEYISDANDGSNHSYSDATVYYGFGRTWSAALRIRF